VITCPTAVAADDPRSYYKVAERIRDERGAFLPYQYYNQANPEAHYRSTGPEIWRQTDGQISHWVAGIGTGGTISGVARYLKEQNPEIRVVGVDVEGSVYSYYFEHRELPPAELIT
jgi:cystathionine beta-synthase